MPLGLKVIVTGTDWAGVPVVDRWTVNVPVLLSAARDTATLTPVTWNGFGFGFGGLVLVGVTVGFAAVGAALGVPAPPLPPPPGADEGAEGVADDVDDGLGV